MHGADHDGWACSTPESHSTAAARKDRTGGIADCRWRRQTLDNGPGARPTRSAVRFAAAALKSSNRSSQQAKLTSDGVAAGSSPSPATTRRARCQPTRARRVSRINLCRPANTDTTKSRYMPAWADGTSGGPRFCWRSITASTRGGGAKSVRSKRCTRVGPGPCTDRSGRGAYGALRCSPLAIR
jgi:hypothetical protein